MKNATDDTAVQTIRMDATARRLGGGERKRARHSGSAVPAKRVRSAAITLAFFPLLAIADAVQAGGLYLNEFGTPSMGTAGAGAQAVASDASTSFHNPAGMTRLEGTQIMGGLGLGVVDTEFDPDAGTPIPGDDGGDAGGLAPILGSFVTHSLTDDLKVGFNVISVSGAVLDYDDSWTGRFLVTDVELLTVSLNPSLAYRVNDWLSLGAGLLAMYGKLDYELELPPAVFPGGGSAEIDGDDWAFSFNIGLLVEPSPRTRFGVIYVGKTDAKFSGDFEVNPPGLDVASDTELTFPQMVRIGAYHELNDQWALLGTVGWEDWSELDNLLVSTEAAGVQIPRNWKDTYHFSGGVHYRPWDDWLFQAGISYDTSPVDSDDRTPDMPMDRQIRYALGVQYDWSERLTLGGAVEFADYGNAKIDNPLLQGDYKDNHIFFFALNANWKF
jgi:long-chain fatty acid transport protein